MTALRPAFTNDLTDEEWQTLELLLLLAKNLRGDPASNGRYSARELATRLSVTISTIHCWRERGIIPAIHWIPNAH